MNWIDVTFLALLIFFLYRGWRLGIIQTFFRYLAVILGLVVAIGYRNYTIAPLQNLGLSLSEKWTETLGFVLLFLLTVVVTLAVGFVLAKIIKPTPLGPVDKILGASFSGLKVVIIFSLLALCISFLPPKVLESKTLSESSTLNATQYYLPYLKQYLKEKSPAYLPESLTVK